MLELKNPHGTATRLDLVRLLYAINDFTAQSEINIEDVVEAFIKRLNIDPRFDKPPCRSGSLNEVQGVQDKS